MHSSFLLSHPLLDDRYSRCCFTSVSTCTKDIHDQLQWKSLVQHPLLSAVFSSRGCLLTSMSKITQTEAPLGETEAISANSEGQQPTAEQETSEQQEPQQYGKPGCNSSLNQTRIYCCTPSNGKVWANAGGRPNLAALRWLLMSSDSSSRKGTGAFAGRALLLISPLVIAAAIAVVSCRVFILCLAVLHQR